MSIMGIIGLLDRVFRCRARLIVRAGPARSRQLAALRELDDRLLADVGITRLEARLGRPLRSRDADRPVTDPRRPARCPAD